jgi:hypothetical protein
MFRAHIFPEAIVRRSSILPLPLPRALNLLVPRRRAEEEVAKIISASRDTDAALARRKVTAAE